MTVAREITKPVSLLIAPERGDSITVNAATQTGTPEVYLPYVRFLALRNPAQRLENVRVTRLDLDAPSDSLRTLSRGERPEAYVPGTLRTWEGKTYYVPLEYRQAYFDLCYMLITRPKLTSTGAGVFEQSQSKIEQQLRDTRDKVDELRSLQLQNQ